MFTEHPYPGLRPFAAEESDIFFGRDEQIAELLKRLQRSRFLAVTGPSGCGKSSLVRAGLIAGMRTGFMVEAGARWRICEMRPGDRPMFQLASALAATQSPVVPAADAIALLRASLRRGPLSFVEVLRETPLPAQTNLLILVDQFEEIFRFRNQGDADEADAFIALLLASAEQKDLPIYVVLTMRSDFLGDCAIFRGLPEAINDGQYLTPRLTREQCGEAIANPARVFDGEVEPPLVNRLLNDFGPDPDQLPLLQHAVMRLWDRARARNSDPAQAITLTLKDYEQLGGLARALSDHADEAYAELSDEQQRIATTLFKRLTERALGKRDTRAPARLTEIAAVAGVAIDNVVPVIESYRRADRCFLTPRVGLELNPRSVIDISHESLIRQWRRLGAWVEQEAESAAMYVRLKQDALLWHEGRKGLWGDPELAYALKWRAQAHPTSAWADRYGASGEFDLALKFLDESQRVFEAKQQRKEAEERRQEALRRQFEKSEHEKLAAEAQVARREAEAQQALAAQQRESARKFRRQRGVAVALALLAILFGVWTVAARKQSEANLLTAQAITALGSDPQLGLAKAAQAHDAAVTPESENALRLALAQSRIARIVPYRLSEPNRLTAYANGVALTESDSSGGHIFAVAGGEASEEASKKTITVYSLSDDPPALESGQRDANRPIATIPLGANEFTGSGIILSPNGKSIALVGQKEVRIYESGTGRLAVTIKPETSVRGLWFARDGARLVTRRPSNAGNVIELWDTSPVSEAPLAKREYPGKLTNIAVSRDAEWVATVDGEGGITLWNTTGRDAALDSTIGKARSVAFSSSENVLAVGKANGAMVLCKLGSGESRCDTELRAESILGARKQLSVQFSGQGNRVAAHVHDVNGGRIVIWDIHGETKEQVADLSDSMMGDCRLNEDGHLMVCWEGRFAQVWNVDREKKLTELSGHRGIIRAAAFRSRSPEVVTASLDGTARVWNLSELDLLPESDAPPAFLRKEATKERKMEEEKKGVVAVSEDGHWLLATTSTPGNAASTDYMLISETSLDGNVETPRDNSFKIPGRELIRASLSKYGKRIAALVDGGNNELKVWVADGKRLQTLRPHNPQPSKAEFQPERGSLLALSPNGNWLVIWNPRGRDEIRLFHFSSAGDPTLSDPQPADFARAPSPLHPCFGTSIAFSGDSESFATGCGDGIVRWFDLKRLTVTLSPVLDPSGVTSVALGPSNSAAVGTNVGSIWWWKVIPENIRDPEHLEGHTQAVTSVRFSTDGKSLVSASEDRTIRVWNLYPTDKGGGKGEVFRTVQPRNATGAPSLVQGKDSADPPTILVPISGQAKLEAYGCSRCYMKGEDLAKEARARTGILSRYDVVKNANPVLD
jgi:WD40 repeat protein